MKSQIMEEYETKSVDIYIYFLRLAFFLHHNLRGVGNTKSECETPDESLYPLNPAYLGSREEEPVVIVNLSVDLRHLWVEWETNKLNLLACISRCF